jgi:hypothetical protein
VREDISCSCFSRLDALLAAACGVAGLWQASCSMMLHVVLRASN